MLDENGERVKLPSGRYKTRKVDLVDWNSQENTEVWRKAWADLANEFLERNNSPERIDHRSFEWQGIDQIPTVHVCVSATQMEKKGITDLDGLDTTLSSVSKSADEIRKRMLQKEKRIKQLEKLIEYAQSYQRHKPIHDEYKQIRWKSKQEKYGKEHRAEVAELQKIRRYVYVALKANAPEHTRTKKQEHER